MSYDIKKKPRISDIKSLLHFFYKSNEELKLIISLLTSEIYFFLADNNVVCVCVVFFFLSCNRNWYNVASVHIKDTPVKSTTDSDIVDVLSPTES